MGYVNRHILVRKSYIFYKYSWIVLTMTALNRVLQSFEPENVEICNRGIFFIFLFVLFSTLLQLPPFRFKGVGICLDRTQVALKKRKCHSLSGGEEMKDGVSEGAGGGYRRQDGVGAFSVLRWCMVALTLRRSCRREKWTFKASGSWPGDCSR